MKVWLIGASEGIGAALALQLKAEGHELILSSRNQKGEGAYPLDVTGEIIAPDNIDCMIYNAGFYEPQSALNFTLTAAEMSMAVNYTGAVRAVHAVLPTFLEKNRGHIVLIGSLAGIRGLPNAIGYGASKAALIHFAENLALDLADTNIKIQLLNPGFVKTRLTDKNTFKMPFIMTADEAAARIVKAMNRNTFMVNFPKRFAIFFTLLKFIPFFLYRKIVA
jgi:short-subunit dehydrogenase